ncbi:hypothetical protein GH714_020274 [Hevea brasiliensis]|uniref:RNase H type-1 domain-containing protein n=1 Tax=Hevea brasiliensis TaxID=3981 RepID=A0A6A6K6B7_HEVBR|nr:hypothetical protein GH714_020274 [Hevea brasiliensis]
MFCLMPRCSGFLVKRLPCRVLSGRLLQGLYGVMGNLEAKEAVPCSQTRQIVHSEGMTSWSKPVANCVKCNSDAAVFQGCDGLGAGWVIRDSSGQLVKACQVKLAVPKDR